jgi:hypothetical protein
MPIEIFPPLRLKNSESQIFYPIASNSMWFSGDTDTLALENRIKLSMILFRDLVFDSNIYLQGVTKDFGFGLTVPTENIPEEFMTNIKRNKPLEIKIEGRKGKTTKILVSKKFSRTGRYYASFLPLLDNILGKNFQSKFDFVHTASLRIGEGGGKAFVAPEMSSEFMKHIALTKNPYFNNTLLRNILDSIEISSQLEVVVDMDVPHSTMLSRLKTAARTQREYIQTGDDVVSLVCPDFSDFSISKIIELRKERSISSFRNKVALFSKKLEGLPDKERKDELTSIFISDFLQDIQELIPTKKKIIIDILIDNIPTIGKLLSIPKRIYNYHQTMKSWVVFTAKLYGKR